jgi:glycosyltransferase involved in cell wall biosynthesis
VSGVVVVLSGFPRRSETFALGELTALLEAGTLMAAFATKPGDGLAPHADADRLSPWVTRLEPGDEAQQADAVVAALAGRRPRAVHGYFAHTPAAIAEQVASRLQVPFGFSVHAKDARKVAPDRLRARARRARAVITCNDDVQRSLQSLGIGAQLIPHGVNLARFTSRPLTVATPVRLLAVGRLVAKKGFDILLRALALVRTPFALDIVGEGPERPALVALAADLRLQGRVRWLGTATHDELPGLYQQAHAVVVPSVVDADGDRDGLPNVVLEAMASGRLVIASDAGAIATTVRDEQTGWLVAAGDVEGLARRIDAMTAQPVQVAEVAAAGRACVERDYEGGACARRFVETLAACYA